MRKAYQIPWVEAYTEALIELGTNPNKTLAPNEQASFFLRSNTNEGQIKELTTLRNNVLRCMNK